MKEQDGSEPSVQATTESWMGQVKGDVTLNRLMLPGSHDAGMSELHHCFPPIGAGPFTQTQSGGFGKQLRDGSRYFDVRVDHDHGELVTYHRSGPHGCNGQSLEPALDQVVAFLQEHRTETAIFVFSHIRKYEDHDPSDTKRRIDELLAEYAAFIYTSDAPAPNLAELALDAVRGKMILVFDYDEYVDPATGRFRYTSGDAAQADANLTVYDEYSNTDSYGVMSEDQLTKWRRHAVEGGNRLFLLSWTLTSTKPPRTPSIKTLASEANGHLPDVLQEAIGVERLPRPNIVYVDFMDSATAQSIIAYNFK